MKRNLVFFIALALTLIPISTYGTDHAGPKTPSCGNYKVTKKEVIVGVEFPKGTYQINAFGIPCSKVMGRKGLFSKFLKLKDKDPLPKPWRYLADAVGAPKFSSGSGVGFRVQLITLAPMPTIDLQKVLLEWVQIPNKLSDPGTLVDPEITLLQDSGLNSTFVVRASIDGKPLKGVEVSWSSDDPSGNLQVFESETDQFGKARSWYVAGKALTQKITVKIVGGRSTVDLTLIANSTNLKTIGRPVILGFVPDTSKNYDNVNIFGTINSDPDGSYYAFANFSNFYTGFQSVVCNGWEKYYGHVCQESRGQFKGRMGLFSVWDGKDIGGKVIRPIVIEKSGFTNCRPFDHEGSGQMCFVSFNWLPSDKLQIKIEKIDGAPSNYQRLKVLGVNLSRSQPVHFATIDVPGGVKLNTEFASFNEHYLVKSADSCFDVEERSFTINKVEFVTGSQVFAPIRAYGYGNVVAPGQSLCENYGFESSTSGIEIFSGGTSRFIDIKPALSLIGSNKQFSSLDQSKIMVRDIPLGILGK